MYVIIDEMEQEKKEIQNTYICKNEEIEKKTNERTFFIKMTTQNKQTIQTVASSLI